MTERMMQGYMLNGDEVTGDDYHGDPHPYNSVCDGLPKCRDVVDKPTKTPRRMYLDPAEDLAPHVGEHDENNFCEGAEPKCIVFDSVGICEKPHETIEEEDACEVERTQPDWKTPPAHYTSKSGIQPWDVWDEFDLDRYTANAVKYILRAGKKDIAPRLDDLIKARNYINKAIDMEENRG